MNGPSQLKNVHHFPGHMKKALRSLEGFVSAADVVLEVRDARIPLSSYNPFLGAAYQGKKPCLIVLSKTDLADPLKTGAWVKKFEEAGIPSFPANLKGGALKGALTKALGPLSAKKRAKEAKNGMKAQPLRLLVIGIPNVGKSTLINNLAGKKAARAENRPGVTRSEQWIKLSEGLVLLDTPGILPMNYDDPEAAKRLALVGSIREEILPLSSLAKELLAFLRNAYPERLKERYGDPIDESQDFFARIAAERGYLHKGGEPDLSKAERLFLKDFQTGRLGQITLEEPGC